MRRDPARRRFRVRKYRTETGSGSGRKTRPHGRKCGSGTLLNFFLFRGWRFPSRRPGCMIRFATMTTAPTDTPGELLAAAAREWGAGWELPDPNAPRWDAAQ